MSIRVPPIGQRGRRFTLELPLDTPDGFGGTIRTYQPGPQLWGAMEVIGTAERVRADAPEATSTHRVTLPFRSGIGPDQRLTLGTRRFRVTHADDPDGSRRALVCLVEEIAA